VLQGWEGAVIGLEGLLLLGGSATKTGPKNTKEQASNLFLTQRQM